MYVISYEYFMNIHSLICLLSVTAYPGESGGGCGCTVFRGVNTYAVSMAELIKCVNTGADSGFISL